MRKLIVAIALALCAAVFPAHADNFPSRPITLIVPFPPGGSTDVTARIMAERMGPCSASRSSSRMSAAPAAASASAARARHARRLHHRHRPVGHPCRQHHLQHRLRSAEGFRADRADDDQSAAADRAQNVSGGRSQIADRLDEGASRRRQIRQPERVGAGRRLLLQKLTDTQVLLVPYRGAGPAMTDLISGQVDLAVFQAAVTMPQVRAGTLKALANLSPPRSQAIPDIPTSDEAGVPGFYMSGWFGLFAPKGTPADVITKLNIAMVQALADPAVRAALDDLGLDVAAARAGDAGRPGRVPEGRDRKWWPIIKAAGIRGEKSRSKEKHHAQSLFHGARGGRPNRCGKNSITGIRPITCRGRARISRPRRRGGSGARWMPACITPSISSPIRPSSTRR